MLESYERLAVAVQLSIVTIYFLYPFYKKINDDDDDDDDTGKII